MKKIYTKGLASLVVTLAKKQTSKKIGFVAGLLLAFGMSAFSQTNYYVRLDSLNAAGTAIVKNRLNLPAYWTSEPSGKGGTSPVDFTTPGQIFNVQSSGYAVGSNTAGAASVEWTISGEGSKLVVGSVDSAVTFSLNSSAKFSGTVDITANRSIFYIAQGNTSTIKLGSIGALSTVRYAGNINGDVQQVIPANYFNLSLAVQTAATYQTVALPAAKIGVAGAFTPRLSSMYGSTIDFNGTGAQTIPAGTYYNLTISGTKSAPDSLRGAVNVMGTFTNTSGTEPIPYTRAGTTTTGNTFTLNGLNPQSIGNDKVFFNVAFSDGIQLPVTAISGNTITLAQANGDLKVGQKVNTNFFTAATIRSNSILLDTSATITAINDTVVTLSSPLKLRVFVQHSSTGGAVDTLYVSSFDAATQTITVDGTLPSTYTDSSVSVYGSNVLLTRGQIFAATTYISSVSGNVITVSKPLVSIHNMGIVSIGNPSSLPSTKTIVGNLRLTGTGSFSSSVPVVTDGSTVILEGQGNRIGGGNNWSYNNLLINQIAAASTVVSAPAYVSGTLTLQSGKITSTSNARFLILNENATFVPSSADSDYVSCPFAKKFNSTTPFTYYMGGAIAGVGNGRKITITPKTADAKTYTVTYANAKTNNSTRIDYNTLNSIDFASYYNVALSANTPGADSSAKISANFYPNASYMDSSIVLAHYNIIGTDTSYKAESAPVTFTGQIPLTLTTADYNTTFGRYVFGTAGPITVPVKLSGVVATALVNKTIKINWSSANEVNVGKYVVEGSVDGVKFSAKGTIASKGSSSYSFVDATPSAGVNYYRIKVIDIDGKVIYSSIVSAKQAATINNISVNPNPVKNKQLSFVLSNDAASYTLKVTNILGKTVVAKTIAHAGGTASYNVSLPSSASAGTYFVEVSNGNSKTTKTIVVE